MTTIEKNLAEIREKIAGAARRTGRDPREIRIVAVSKKVDPSLMREAITAGQQIFGENYMQEAKEKIITIEEKAQWHFIGHLQSNKAKDAAYFFDAVHTVDRLKLANALNRYAGEAGKNLSVLVQVNVGEEPQKEGVATEDAEELLQSMQGLSNLSIEGLMTMPPFYDDPEKVRPYFRKLRELADDFASRGYFAGAPSFELSMGMSGDFEVAVEEGATLVRIGTSIFGARPAGDE
ncbi:MAG: YggS family pyridoxal phosphate-dependent enzyme [Pseudomonadota bacterium]